MRKTSLLRYPSVSLTLLCAFCSIAFAQVKNTKVLSDSQLPPPLRVQLIQRLNLFARYDRSGDFEKQFALLADSKRRSAPSVREGYAKSRRNEAGLIFRTNFSGMRIYATSEGWDGKSFGVQVVTKSKYQGDNLRTTWYFTCWLINGDWYFDYQEINRSRAEQIVGRERRGRVS